jgi:hypothetical protein
MVDINLLKHIFGDANVVTISSPEDVQKMADFFKKVQPKEEEEKHKHDCSKRNMPQDLCFAKSEIRNRFKEFAAEVAASSISRITMTGDPVLVSFSTATILKFINPNSEISGLKPTLLTALDKIKEGDKEDEKAVAEVLLDLILLYLWCNNK